MTLFTWCSTFWRRDIDNYLVRTLVTQFPFNFASWLGPVLLFFVLKLTLETHA